MTITKTMTIKELTYFCLALLTGFFSACSDDVVTPATLSGNGEKTPIGVTALLDASSAAKTRAVNMAFAENDKLYAYLRHVKWDGTTGARTLVSVDKSPVLVTFTKGSSAMTAYTGSDIEPIGLTAALGLTSTNTQQTADLTADPVLYWDDFSANDANDGTESSTNLRDDGHYLQSFYGYCYNGGTPSTALTETTGVLGWTVQTDQKTAADKSAFQHSDLLWSAEQTPIDYRHAVAERKGLVLPYTHAMSKVTLNVTVSGGFVDDYKLTGVTATLNNMFTKCTCTAPTYSLTGKGSAAGTAKVDDITMWQGSTETAKQCSWEAIVVPSILSVGNKFATLTGLDGNTYTIPVTEEMLSVSAWGSQLTVTDEHINNGVAQAPLRTRTTTIAPGKGREMKSGVHYVLNVSLNKQGITVSALIKDWIDVEASGRGEILFDPDNTEKGTIAEELKTGGFDVYKNRVNTTFTSKTTTLTWETDKWQYAPAIYWTGQSDVAYFRALSPKATDPANIAQDDDVLWGYALDAAGTTVSEAERATVGEDSEVAITPRTGNVPLHFEHAMSKITVNLETASGDYTLATCPAVNLTGAQIEISNLATTGSINLVNGDITPAATTADAIARTAAPISNKTVIPQTIGDDAIIKITLADGTTYKLPLNTCKVQTGTDPETGTPIYEYITEWQRGKHYTYTIHIEKEAITFRALIKDWVEKTGGGNANLDWD